METPLQLEIEGLTPSTHLRALIEDNVTKLERHYGRMTACRVAIRAPDAHHKLGEPYFVSVRIALPGRRDVSVKPPPRARDRRQADVMFAVNDAFRRADRQLRVHASKLKEVQKQHVSQPHGKVLRVDTDRNFGIIESGDGREIYFHANSVLDGKFRQLRSGSTVAFHEEMGEKGPQASSVRVI
ncbi:MAG TPA: HPF/RaiA family ribosome-associated protein [Rhizomicrobium sp.]|nr:HPF/RaiA family ribosome-associated protein [Rhizomicrobium sp.]